MTSLHRLHTILLGSDSYLSELEMFINGFNQLPVEDIMQSLNDELNSGLLSFCKEELEELMFGVISVDFNSIEAINNGFKKVERICNLLLKDFETYYPDVPDYAKYELHRELEYLLLGLLNLIKWFYNAYVNLKELELNPEDYIFIKELDASEFTLKPSSRLDLSLREIALLCYYEGIHVSNTNKDEVVKVFGQNSGHKLYQHYNKYIKKQERTGEDVSPSKNKLERKIELFKNVRDVMKPEFFSKIDEDISILEKRYKTEYL